MSYPVYLVEYLGLSRNHHAIFVETNPSDFSGYTYHVIGNIQEGMKFDHKEAKKPELSNTFVGKTYLGTVSESNYSRVQGVVQTVLPPEKQFDGPKRIDPKKRIRRCQEWVSEAVQALREEGILEETEQASRVEVILDE